jgi:hypothetical protein
LHVIDNVEAIHAGHVLINHETASRAAPVIGEKLASRVVRTHIEPEALEQHLQRIGNPLVVIDNADKLVTEFGRLAHQTDRHADLS